VGWILWFVACVPVECVPVDPADVSLAYDGCAAASECCADDDCWLEVADEVIDCAGLDCEDATYEFLAEYCPAPDAPRQPSKG
jgi:hypothetical protein